MHAPRPARARLSGPPRGVTQFSESDEADFATLQAARARLEDPLGGVVHFLGSESGDFGTFPDTRYVRQWAMGL